MPRHASWWPHRTRRAPLTLNIACALAFAGIWIEKGMGLVVPGFIPTPLGEVFEYTPTAHELLVTLGIWAFGAIVFTLLAKAALASSWGRCASGRPPRAPPRRSRRLQHPAEQGLQVRILDLPASEGGMGSLPHTLALPLRTRSASRVAALPCPLYLAAMACQLEPVMALSGAWHMAQPACVASWGDATAGSAIAAAQSTRICRICIAFSFDKTFLAIVERGFPRWSASSQQGAKSTPEID